MLQDKFQSLEFELNNAIFERKDIVRASLLAMLTKTNLLQLGAPGSAKSHLVRLLSDAFESSYFQILLSKFTTPDEVFGPVSLKALKEDKYVRLTNGKLPTSQLVFLDETFKGSSAINNSLLTALNERLYDDGNGMKPIPTVSFFGASNEGPDSEYMLAFYDRFLQRFNVEYLEESDSFEDLLFSNFKDVQIKISNKELEQAQGEVKSVQLTHDVVTKIAKIRARLKYEGLNVSDRRYRESVKLLQASAWLNQRSVVDEADLEVLANVLWETKEQIEMVRDVIQKTMDPTVGVIKELYDSAQTIIKETDLNSTTSIVEATVKIGEIGQQMAKIFSENGGSVHVVGRKREYVGGNQKIVEYIMQLRENQRQLTERMGGDTL